MVGGGGEEDYDPKKARWASGAGGDDTSWGKQGQEERARQKRQRTDQTPGDTSGASPGVRQLMQTSVNQVSTIVQHLGTREAPPAPDFSGLQRSIQQATTGINAMVGMFMAQMAASPSAPPGCAQMFAQFAAGMAGGAAPGGTAPSAAAPSGTAPSTAAPSAAPAPEPGSAPEAGGAPSATAPSTGSES